MTFIKDLIAANLITQSILLYLFYANKAFFDSLFVVHQNTNAYFWFLVIGGTATLWLIWTGFTFIFGIRRLGYKAENATKRARS